MAPCREPDRPFKLHSSISVVQQSPCLPVRPIYAWPSSDNQTGSWYVVRSRRSSSLSSNSWLVIIWRRSVFVRAAVNFTNVIRRSAQPGEYPSGCLSPPKWPFDEPNCLSAGLFPLGIFQNSLGVQGIFNSLRVHIVWSIGFLQLL